MSSLFRPSSWVIVETATDRVLMETYQRAVVDALNTARYTAVPILEYLQGLNRKQRA